MSSQYYSLMPIGREEDWYLKVPADVTGTEIDVWLFTDGTRYMGDKIYIDVKYEGNHSAITFSAYGFPVLSAEIANELAKICGDEIQLVESTVKGHGNYYILNVLNIVDCLDHSCVRQYYPKDFEENRLRGKPRAVGMMKIDTTKLNHNKIFRVKDWEIPIVVSDDVYKVFKKFGSGGMRAT
ncbi:MAG: hypothetical protein R3B84_22980 [Zavarzinella sp.]